MLTKTSGLFSSHEFNEETLREDLVEVRRLFRAEGLLDAEVVLENLRFSDDKTEVVVVIAITEGERYTVGDVTFDLKRETEGPGAMPPDDVAFFTQDGLRTMLGLVSGAVYSGKVEDKGRDKIKEAYYARSYLEATIERAVLTPRATGRIVDVRVKVDEGRKYRVGRILVVGNEFTRDKIIRREIGAGPGDYVDRNALDRGLARLRGTRFFDRTTRRFDDVPGPDGKPVPDLKDVVYEVTEAKTGKLTIGAALSSDGGLSANFQFQKRNFDIARPPRSWGDLESGRAFTGAGQTFGVFLNPGTVISSYGVNFGEPRLFGSKFGLSVSAAKRVAFRESYRENVTGYNVRLSHPIVESNDDRWYLDASVGWRQEVDDIDEVRDSAVPGVFLFEGPQQLRALVFGMSFHHVDDAVRPLVKASSAAAFEYTGGFLGGDLNFWKAGLNHEQKYIVREHDDGQRESLTLTGTFGVSHAFGDTPEVPPISRYYAGGRGTLRGFAYRGVGPHSNNRPMGGEFILVGTAEYEYPFVENFLSAVAFSDGGFLGTSIAEDDAWLPRWSVGFGLRVKIPMLGDAPLALDFAVPLVKQDEDETLLVSFSLARDF